MTNPCRISQQFHVLLISSLRSSPLDSEGKHQIRIQKGNTRSWIRQYWCHAQPLKSNSNYRPQYSLCSGAPRPTVPLFCLCIASSRSGSIYSVPCSLQQRGKGRTKGRPLLFLGPKEPNSCSCWMRRAVDSRSQTPSSHFEMKGRKSSSRFLVSKNEVLRCQVTLSASDTTCAVCQSNGKVWILKAYITLMNLAIKYLDREHQTHSKTMARNKLKIYIPIKISATYQNIFQ